MMAPPLPPDLPPNLLKYLRDLARYVSMEFKSRTPDEIGHQSVILLSPDGAAWEFKVGNDGVLSTTKVQG